MNKEKLQNIGDAQALYRDLRRRMDPIRTISKAAPVISFDNGGDSLPLKELKVDIQPVQDLHGYSKPWAGGCGKNLFNVDELYVAPGYEGGITLTNNNDGSITLSGVADSSSCLLYCKLPYSLPANTNVTISLNNSTTNAEVGARISTIYADFGDMVLADETNKIGISHLPGVQATHINVFVKANHSAVSAITLKIQCEIGDIATDWSPYSNICPISGWTGAKVTRTGKNLITNGNNTANGYVNGYRINADGTTPASPATSISEYFKVNPSKRYTISQTMASSLDMAALCFYDANKTYISGERYRARASFTVTSPSNARYCRITYVNDTSSYGYQQMEEGSTATTYELYTGTAYPITFPTSAGTVYGGTLTVNKDGTGVLTVDRACAVANALNTNMRDGGFRFYYNQQPLASQVNVQNLISNKIPVATDTQLANILTAHESFCYIHSNTGGFNFSTTKEYSSVSEMFADIGEIQFVYELATPVTYYLSAPQVKTLLGQNNIWADTGDILKLSYQADNHISSEVNEAKNEWVSRTIDYPSDVLRLYDAAEDLPVKKMKIGIEPVQDLHGYDKPWVGGAGKNLLPISLESMKTTSTAGTWSGDVYSRYGVSLSVVKDNDGNIIGVNANGTSTDIVFLGWIVSIKAGSYIISSNVSNSNCSISLRNNVGGEVLWNASAVGTETRLFTVSSDTNNVYVNLRIASGVSLSDVKFYPMIRLSTVTDATFAPYSNICSISGHTGCEITRVGENVFTPNSFVDNKYIAADGTPKGEVNFRYTELIPVKPGKSYSLQFDSVVADAANYRIHGYDKEGNWLEQLVYINSQAIQTHSSSFDIPSTVNYIRFSYRKDTQNISIKQENAYSISFPSPTPGTVYGGTLTVNNDGSGELVVDKELRTYTGSENWNETESGFSLYNVLYKNFYFFASVSNMMKVVTSDGETGMRIILGLGTKTMYLYNVKNAIPGVTDVTTWKTYLNTNNLQVVVPISSLNIPLTAPQVKLLLGYNQIYASTGDILEATYYKDVPMAYELDDVRKLLYSLLPAAGNSF